ncbi:oxidoreductase [Frondihabitans sp. PAMC 28766]|uniref:aldo/keto reductase n=1 Tax=Frondihabitans sp. PAMC 28766 TaxID=1795630 RepID=UPI00078E62F0|nr:aldo/keto reductase [Frondihabitans sp. PAMC 28766]AMM19973.1 oxidoreductase [Frondihabitans sp. PAMC 28766]
MRYQTFGRRSGLRVSELVLGTANFGSAPTSAGVEGSRAIFDSFVAAGGTTFDTSSIYQAGESERVLGTLLGHERDRFVVVTKYSASIDPQARPSVTGNSRKSMVRSVEDSLARLKTDYVDILMPHFPDGITPMAEILAGFDELIQAGKIRYGGLSNFPAWRVAGAALRSELGSGSSVIGIQTEYSLAERSAERELLPMAEAHGLGVVMYSPLAGGLLTGKYRRGEEGRLSTSDRLHSGQRDAVLDAVLDVASALETPPAQIALAWLRKRASLSATSLVPIVGPRTTAHLDGYLASLDVELDDRHYEALETASAIRLGAPFDDVVGALRNGADGDRSQLTPSAIPAI